MGGVKLGGAASALISSVSLGWGEGGIGAGDDF